MNDDIINKYIKEKDDINYFNFLAKENINKIREEQQKISNEQKEIDDTLEAVKIISEHACIDSLVKLSPICYIPATLKHTGEYNVAFTPTYRCTLTQKQTVEYLNRKHSELSDVMDVFEGQLQQLQDRIDLEQPATESTSSSYPMIIKSDKGVAFKRGMFYEIVEQDLVDAPLKGKRISRIKNKVTST